MRLLLAEDERDLSNALVTILTIKQYEVDAVYDGNEAWRKCQESEYDGIVLDIMMPGMSGLEVLEKIRTHHITTPVMMLTARSEVEDRVKGLENGADDYLAKPFAMNELLARINAMVRRQTNYMPQVYSLGNTILKAEGMELSVGENALRLAGREAQMLALFMNAPGRTITRKQLAERIWKEEEAGENEKTGLYISYLQGKLESLHADVMIVEQEEGYRLEVNHASKA